MYGFCEAHGLRDAWAYLYERWYREPWFKKWARSARVAVPIGKTTMMIESQWRILKRDFLINNPRPRLDLLVWIIIHKQSRPPRTPQFLIENYQSRPNVRLGIGIRSRMGHQKWS